MQIYTYACKWFKHAETCFGHSWEFALWGCFENVIVEDLNWLTPPAPHSVALPRFVQCYFHLDENYSQNSTSIPNILQSQGECPSTKPRGSSTVAASGLPRAAQSRAAKHHSVSLVYEFPPKKKQISLWCLKGDAGVHTQLTRSQTYEQLLTLHFKLLSTLQHLIPNSLLQPGQKLLFSSSMDF